MHAPDLGALFFNSVNVYMHHKKKVVVFFLLLFCFLSEFSPCSVFVFGLEAFLVFSLWKELSAANLTAWCDATVPLLR